MNDDEAIYSSLKRSEDLILEDENLGHIVPAIADFEALNKFSKDVVLVREKEQKKENVRVVPKFSQAMRNRESKIHELNNSQNAKNTEDQKNFNITVRKVVRRPSVFTDKILPLKTMVQTMVKNWRRKSYQQKIENLSETSMRIFGDIAYIKDVSGDEKGKHMFFTFEEIILKIVQKVFDSSIFKNKLSTIHPEGRLKLGWNIFICLCILFQFFTITIELFFDTNWDKVDGQLRSVTFKISELLKYLILIDIFLNMITGYFYRGEIVMEARLVLKNYFKRLLIVDILVVFPMFFTFENDDELQEENILHVGALYNSKLSLIKLLFVFRLVKLKRTYYYIEQILSNNEKIEGFLSLLKLCFSILFTAHLIACIWYFLGDLGGKSGRKTWIYEKLDASEDFDWRSYYLISLYWSITTMITVGYGDITPTNTIEISFVICSMIIGCGLFGYSLSNIGLIFGKIFARENELRSKIRVITRYMRRKNIDFELQGKVRRYLDFILRENSQDSSEKELELINKLSLSLRKELLLQANGNILLNSSFLNKNFSVKFIERLTEYIIPVDLAPEEYVFEEGAADSDSLFFVSKGFVDLFMYCENATGDSFLKLKTLKEGDVFGEISLFTGKPRECSALSVGYTKVFMLKKADILMALKENQKDYEKYCMMRDNILLYSDHSLNTLACVSCGENDHQVLKCPRICYLPDRDLVVQRYLYRKKLQRKKFNRKEKSKFAPLLRIGQLTQKKERLEEFYDFSDYEKDLNLLREEWLELLQQRQPTHGLFNYLHSHNEKGEADEENSECVTKKSLDISVELDSSPIPILGESPSKKGNVYNGLERSGAPTELYSDELLITGSKPMKAEAEEARPAKQRTVLSHFSLIRKLSAAMETDSKAKLNEMSQALTKKTSMRERLRNHRLTIINPPQSPLKHKTSRIMERVSTLNQRPAAIGSKPFNTPFSNPVNAFSPNPLEARSQSLLNSTSQNPPAENFSNELFLSDFDIGRNFHIYFPKNNPKNVIFEIRKKSYPKDSSQVKQEMNMSKTEKNNATTSVFASTAMYMSPRKRKSKLAKMNAATVSKKKKGKF